MSVLSVAPELVSVAAGDLSGIGSAICEANVAAVAPTLGVVAPAADSVSVELAALFGGHAQTYQAVSTQADVFHQEFVSTLSRSSAAYTQAEAESASGLGKGHGAEGMRRLGSRQHQAAGAGSRLWEPSRPALWRPGMSDPRLITPQHSLPAGSRLWHPGLPGFKTHNGCAPRLFTPHNGLMGGIGNGVRGILQQIGEDFRQIISNQIGYLKLVGSSFEKFIHDEIAAIKNLPTFWQKAVSLWKGGNYGGAVRTLAYGFDSLFLNGVSMSKLATTDQALFHLTGPLADLMQVLYIPADIMQNTAEYLKPLGFGILGNLVQRLANPLEILANGWYFLDNGATGDFLMGRPLQIAFDLLGAPIVTWLQFTYQVQAVMDALHHGHLLQGLVDIVQTPAKLTEAYLFGQDYVKLPIGSIQKNGRSIHVGGLFAPLDYEWGYNGPASGGAMTGGLFAAMISMLPQWIQDPLQDFRHFIDGLVAILERRPVLDY